ncbi:DUF2059 domain-containing protein [Undibacterium terreum]|uniref:DUF2059 domain-containing protein n=1 Tax=Undibacterium terreum TaxID=1224302 RepID=A0A916XM16_9BURK|nr:DUF2059 domain-containing protein [Undibacterium terreum]GGC82870.1 hypothetical protein GCM10011396_32760 [Undibacterium terreum]
MKRLVTFAAATLFSLSACAAPPSPESLEKLFAVMHVERILDAIRPQTEAAMKVMLNQAMKGQTLTADQQKVLDNFWVKANAINREEMTMEKLKPLYVRVYSASLEQEDVDGLIAFYESPTGQVFINKMPRITQGIMSEMPQLMAPLMQKIMQAAEEMHQQLDALQKARK